MLAIRVIPALLLLNEGLVKTVRFKDPKYIGDPINAVRIFNDKGVDELIFLDIGPNSRVNGPNFALLERIATEAFMPFGYGGGVTTIEQVRRLYSLGIEKVVLNSAVASNPGLVKAAAYHAGSTGVVVSMDVRRNWLGRASVWVEGASRDLKRDPVEYARYVEELGAGEILVNAVHKDGTMEGYDLELIHAVSAAVSIPVVALGGAGSLEDFRAAIGRGASAVAAGSLFVFHGKHRAVLITYPSREDCTSVFSPR
jgi:imidazole glycerol-phosphate synthase subunit HisF